MLEAAIKVTNDKGILLDMNQLSRITLIALNLPKMTRSEQEAYKELSLDQWVDKGNQQKQQVVVKNSNDVVDAFLQLSRRHRDLKGKQELLEEKAGKVKKVF